MQKFPILHSVTQESRQSFVMVRSVYYRAAHILSDPGMLGGMLALIQCDFAMELLMKTILREAVGEFYEFEKWDDIKSRLASTAKELGEYVAIDLAQATHWHRQRNSVQHLGMVLPRESTEKALGDYERTFRAIYRKVLGLDFDQLMDADVLEPGMIRDWLVEAGQKLAANDTNSTLSLVMTAYFYTILAAMERKIREPYGPLISLDHRRVDDVTRWLWETHVRVAIRELGVPAQDFVWMSHLDSCYGPDKHILLAPEPSLSEARKALNIAIETALILGTQQPSRSLTRVAEGEDQGPPLPVTRMVIADGESTISCGFGSTSQLQAFDQWLGLKHPINRTLAMFSHRIGGGWYQFVVAPNKVTVNDYLYPGH